VPVHLENNQEQCRARRGEAQIYEMGWAVMALANTLQLVGALSAIFTIAVVTGVVQGQAWTHEQQRGKSEIAALKQEIEEVKEEKKRSDKSACCCLLILIALWASSKKASSGGNSGQVDYPARHEHSTHRT